MGGVSDERPSMPEQYADPARPGTAPDPVDPLDRAAWPLRTERLLVRRATRADAVATYGYRRLPDVGRWLPYPEPSWAVYEELWCDPERMRHQLAVEHSPEPGGRVVGDLMVRVQDAWTQRGHESRGRGAEAEVGWAFDPAVGGQGLATEAVRGLLGLCFDQLGVRRVVGICFTENEPSWRLMERLGMRREAHLVGDSFHGERGWCDSYSYALLAEEWRG